MTAISWRAMSEEEYAAFERSQGERVVNVRGLRWRQVRPFFYRPLLPFEVSAAGSVHVPLQARLGGYQFAVTPEAAANSHIGMLLFRQTQAYSLDSLQRQKRQQVLHAAKEFVVRAIDDVEEFKRDGHEIYLSFMARTDYAYKSERLRRQHFVSWADSIFRFPKNLTLGAYRDGKLQGASISRLVGDTVVYSTMFSSGEALARNVNSLLLHTLREAASVTPGVRQIFISMASSSGPTSIEQFFLVRGCELVHIPALLRLNPLARLYLEHRMPRQLATLTAVVAPEPASATESSNP